MAGVPLETLSPDQVHNVDAIGLPEPGGEVVGRSERRDSYPIVVTRRPEETVERLLRLVGDASVAVITDTTVERLYGDLLIGALDKAGIHPEVAVVPAGERHKTLGQAAELLDWLTGTQIGRRDVIVLLGGGVVIDMGGWGRRCRSSSGPPSPTPWESPGQMQTAMSLGDLDEVSRRAGARPRSSSRTTSSSASPRGGWARRTRSPPPSPSWRRPESRFHQR